MRKRTIYFLIPALLIGLLSFSVFKNEANPEKEKVLKELIFKGLMDKAHFNSIKINDDLSEKAFKQYLEKLDPGKRFLTKKDVEELNQFKLSIDDDISGKYVNLVPVSIRIWNERLAEAKTYCNAILDKEFDFTKNETAELNSDDWEYANNKTQLKERWRKYLKYQSIVRYHNKLENQEKKAKEAKEKGEEFKVKSDKDLETEVRKEVLRNFNNLFDRLEKQDEEDKFSDYVNSILAVYGPHTEYYLPYDKEEFDIQMSGRLEGIGAQLTQMDGNIKVTRIVIGSASWKQGELKEEDVILKVAQGEDEPVSVEGMPLKDAVSMIRGKKGTEVRLSIKKPDGRLLVVPIIRDVVILEESYAKSAVIKDDESGLKIGYILLPSFYADFQRSGGPSSAKDVKKELEKLKKENVDGIVLDLRSNGGGSLRDAVEMSGLFIEKGPIVQVRSKIAEPIVYEDKNSSITWDGPLVVMVNKISASASEILAAAMQDYGRAIIVGSSTTFGKGTVQQFFEMDNYLPQAYSQIKPLGSVKLTVQKFYRITGKSTQWKGVEPDVILPDVYNYLDIGERSLKYALPWDEIGAKDYDQWQSESDLKLLAKNSQIRLEKNEIFQLIEENAKRMKTQQDKKSQTLNFDAFTIEQEQLDAEAKKFKNLKKVHENLSIYGEVAKGGDSADSVKVARMEKWHKEIKEDVYLYEAIQVLEDHVKNISIASGNNKAKHIKD
ncbi:MAG: carboxy terminal-processing peptidase [Flammeovirgaceae bacterium]|nr:carboxy terminal-processing peptidase [Flammeovirgaceae bacterium]